MHANFMALCFIEPWLLSIAVLHCSCDLDLEPMTLIYEHDSYSVKMYRKCKYELPTSRLSKVIFWQTDIQTDRVTRPKLYTTPLRGWSKITKQTEKNLDTVREINWKIRLSSYENSSHLHILAMTRVLPYLADESK